MFSGRNEIVNFFIGVLVGAIVPIIGCYLLTVIGVILDFIGLGGLTKLIGRLGGHLLGLAIAALISIIGSAAMFVGSLIGIAFYYYWLFNHAPI